MKCLKPRHPDAQRFIFFLDPPEDYSGSPEWNDPEKSRRIALSKLRDLRTNTQNESLIMCLQFLEQLLTDSLEFEIGDENLKAIFIEKLHELSLPVLVSDVTRASTLLKTRTDFDHSNCTPEEYFTMFIICWIELTQ